MFKRVADEVTEIGRGMQEVEEAVGLRGRKYYGAFNDDGEYRVCVQHREADDPQALGPPGHGLIRRNSITLGSRKARRCRSTEFQATRRMRREFGGRDSSPGGEGGSGEPVTGDGGCGTASTAAPRPPRFAGRGREVNRGNDASGQVELESCGTCEGRSRCSSTRSQPDGQPPDPVMLVTAVPT